VSAWQSTGPQSGDSQRGAAQSSGPPSRPFLSRRATILLGVAVLILFLFRPGVYHLRTRIAASIGNALGRRVEINNVRLRLLPRPGFDLEGLVIYDDPAFSAEPMIRANAVTAAIRLRSLFRGRLEIANLSATEPSINLVRNQQNHWNLTALIERNAQIAAAPTAKTASERRPAFPYLEATDARINFKIGETKKSYALTEAKVALWQDSENSWGARLKARPVRTDFNLTDTGSIQINANWQRAANMASTPLEIKAQWTDGQLGQITKLFSGTDRGWRGGVTLTANATGTPESLRIESHIALAGFHRYDIVNSDDVGLATDCSGQYNLVTTALANLVCESPAGNGLLNVRGTVTFAPQTFGYDLTIHATKVPLGSLLRLFRQAKAKVPGALSATGILDGEFHGADHAPGVARKNPRAINFRSKRSRAEVAPDAPQWSGTGTASDVHLIAGGGALGSSGDDISLGTFPLRLVVATETGEMQVPGGKRDTAEPTQLVIGPSTLTLNNGPAVKVGGSIARSGYSFFLRGNADLKDLARLQTAFAIPGSRPEAHGSAILDLTASGSWKGFASPTTTGTAQLRNVRASIRGVSMPIEISSTNVLLSPDAVELQKISAVIGNTRWSGSVLAPRYCNAANVPPGPISDHLDSGSGSITNPVTTSKIDLCALRFDLTADRFSNADLASWLIPKAADHPWYSILNSTTNSGAGAPSPLKNICAVGKLQVGQFEINKLSISQIVTAAGICRGKITLPGLKARLLHGTHQGNWTIDATQFSFAGPDNSTNAIAFHGDGTFTDISLSQLSALTNEHWIDGKGDARFEVAGSTDSLHDALTHSDAKAHVTLRNGVLPRVELPGGSSPLPVHRFTGDLQLNRGVWELSDGILQSRDGLYRISGKATPAAGAETMTLDLSLTRGDDQRFTIAGTLVKPLVTAGSRTVARNSSMNGDPKDVPTKIDTNGQNTKH
jgi:hypothetical protein